MIHRLSPSPKPLLVLAATLGIGLPYAGHPASTDSANHDASGASMRYEVTFVPSWNPATHPFEYPITHGKKGLLTPAIGATHDDSFKIFCPGTRPTPGLERLSEMGRQDPLDAELEAACGTGAVGGILRFAEGSPGPVHPAVGTSFHADDAHTLVSIVGMIAPSPDWFYGVSSVDLKPDGSWIPSLVVPAYAWDSGGDAGTTYMAEDMDLEPKELTRRAATEHFMHGGEACPVGYFVFKQVPHES